jgi:hypothetical protein
MMLMPAAPGPERRLVTIAEQLLHGAPLDAVPDNAVLLGRYQSLDGRHAVSVLSSDAVVPAGNPGGRGERALFWRAQHLGDPFPDLAPSGGALVVVQREYPEPVTREEVRARRHAASACLELYRVRPISSCLALDGRRQICWFEGPDAESVRQMVRVTTEPFTRIWPARVGSR